MIESTTHALPLRTDAKTNNSTNRQPTPCSPNFFVYLLLLLFVFPCVFCCVRCVLCVLLLPACGAADVDALLLHHHHPMLVHRPSRESSPPAGQGTVPWSHRRPRATKPLRVDANGGGEGDGDADDDDDGHGHRRPRRSRREVARHRPSIDQAFLSKKRMTGL